MMKKLIKMKKNEQFERKFEQKREVQKNSSRRSFWGSLKKLKKTA
jgi:hypothetical protein